MAVFRISAAEMQGAPMDEVEGLTNDDKGLLKLMRHYGLRPELIVDTAPLDITPYYLPDHPARYFFTPHSSGQARLDVMPLTDTAVTLGVQGRKALVDVRTVNLPAEQKLVTIMDCSPHHLGRMCLREAVGVVDLSHPLFNDEFDHLSADSET